MTTSKILAFTSVSFKTGVSSLVVLGLVGCDGLARFNTKKDAPPTEPVVAEESTGTTASPGSVSSTATETPDEPEKKEKVSSPLYEWKGDGRKITRIVVNTNEQKARFYSGEDEVGWSTVATGLPKYPTPTGRFQVKEKVENKRSNLYGKVYGKGGRVLRSSVKVGRDPIPDGGRFEGAKMPFFMRLTDDGVGLHAGPIPNPGRPASHGCIRMPSKIAPMVFRHVSHGTAVTIEGKGPNYGDYAAKQRANAARRAEERRIAEQRAAESRKAQQIAQAAPSATDTATNPQDAANSEMRETHAVAKDEATPATQAIDTTNARETRMHEPATQPESVGVDTENSTEPTKPTEPPAAPVSGAVTPTPAATNPGELRSSIIEAPAQNAPAPATGGLPSSIREGAIELGPQPAEPAPASSTTRPAPEIREAPAPAPQPAAPTAETSAPAPQAAPAPASKPAEPAPAAGPQPSAAPAAAPAGSAAE